MRLLFGLLSYLVAAVAIISGAAALLFSTVEPAVRTMQPQQEAPKDHRAFKRGWTGTPKAWSMPRRKGPPTLPERNGRKRFA
jgi:hypothetical protein